MLSYKSNLELSNAHHLSVAERILEGVLFDDSSPFGITKPIIFDSKEEVLMTEIFCDEKDYLFLDYSRLKRALSVLIYDHSLIAEKFEERMGVNLMKALKRDAFSICRQAWFFEFYDGFLELIGEAKNKKVKKALKTVAVMFLDEIRKSSAPISAEMLAKLCKWSPEDAYAKLCYIFEDSAVDYSVEYDMVLEELGVDETSRKIGEYLICHGFVWGAVDTARWLIKAYPDGYVDMRYQVAFMKIALRGIEHYIENQEYLEVLRPFFLNKLYPKVAVEILLLYIEELRKEINGTHHVEGGTCCCAKEEMVEDLLELLTKLPAELQTSLLCKGLYNKR